MCCSVFEDNESVDGWVVGKSVGFCEWCADVYGHHRGEADKGRVESRAGEESGAGEDDGKSEKSEDSGIPHQAKGL